MALKDPPAKHAVLLSLFSGIVTLATFTADWGAGYAAPVACALLGLMVFVSLPSSDLKPMARLSGRVVLAVSVVSVLAVLQTVRLPLGLADPIWTEAGNALDGVSGALGVHRGSPLVALGAIVAAALSFLLAMNLTRDENSFFMLWLGLVMLAGVILVGLTLAALIGGWWGGPGLRLGPAAIGPFTDRDAAACYYGVLALVAFALLRYRYSRLRSEADAMRYSAYVSVKPETKASIFLLGGFFVIFLAALAWTGSLAGQFSVVIGLLVVSTIYAVKRASTAQRLTGTWTTRALVLLVIAIALLGMMIANEGVASACRWSASWEAAKANLFLGSGFGTARDIFQLYQTSECLQEPNALVPHDFYLAVIASGGLVSLAAVAFVIAVAGRVFVAGVGSRQRLRVFPIACLGILAMLIVHAALGFPLQYPGLAVFVAAVLGSGASVSLARQPGSGQRVAAGPAVTVAPGATGAASAAQD
ncbi:O-antigen ligase family protein [Chthonobacter albigriseus]|uniref:O-antigen ligase family protein n=1 Tax=Chthonobacter albigriseus TaxID=1683161 RepID=UPI0015EF419D|nr:hypothetical protein [Chthonobacter albigriseus]